MTPAPTTAAAEAREDLVLGPALRKSLATLRGEVRDCIGEAIPLRRRWVSAIMDRVVGPLASALAASDARLAAVTAERDAVRASAQKMHRRCQSGEGDLRTQVAHLKSGVEWWRIQHAAAEHQVGISTARVAALEAENAGLLIALAFLDRAAGEGLGFVADGDFPDVDAADLFCAIAKHLGREIDAPEMMALVERGRTALIATQEAPHDR